MPINHDRVQQAFERYPMCEGDLAVEAPRWGKGVRHAVCAVGALIVDTGAATPEDLVHENTDLAIDRYWPQLRATYGFRTKRQLHAYVDVNDEAFAKAPPAVRRRDRTRAGKGEIIRAALLRALNRSRALARASLVGRAKQGRQVKQTVCQLPDPR
jgi:hypothetical protein